jgi:DNA invertase Pin-like site-specific DNA recombinase
MCIEEYTSSHQSNKDHHKVRFKRNDYGNASLFILPWQFKPNTRVVIYVRVSTRQQDHKNNLDSQIQKLKNAVAASKGIVVKIVTYIGSGFDPWKVGYAAEIARKHNAIIVAESTDRLIRSPNYHSVTNPNARARTFDLESLAEATRGISLMTLHHPDESLKKVRSAQIFRGIKNKRSTTTKPGDRARIRVEWEAKLAELNKEGMGYKRLRKLLHSETGVWIGLTTIGRWVKEWNGDRGKETT